MGHLLVGGVIPRKCGVTGICLRNVTKFITKNKPDVIYFSIETAPPCYDEAIYEESKAETSPPTYNEAIDMSKKHKERYHKKLITFFTIFHQYQPEIDKTIDFTWSTMVRYFVNVRTGGKLNVK